MKKRSIRKLTTALAAIAMLTTSVAMIGTANADRTVDVQPGGAPWGGFMEVSDLDRSGAIPAPTGPVIFGSGWGVPDLTAVFDTTANSGTVTLGPNTVGDPDPFWYIGGGGPGQLGNKWMDASLFIGGLSGSDAGMNLTFEGTVLSNTFTANHTGIVYIREFNNDFSFFIGETSAPLTAGAFSITRALDADPTNQIQYGFNVQGENVWVTDVGPFGTIVVATVPEPASLMVLGLGAIGLISRRRRR